MGDCASACLLGVGVLEVVACSLALIAWIPIGYISRTYVKRGGHPIQLLSWARGESS